jgi:hypothetical protein
MPIDIPARIDREDQEKFLRILKGDANLKVDRQDYSPLVATEMVDEGYINDEDVYTKMKQIAADAP